MTGTLEDYARHRGAREALMATKEWRFTEGIAAACFRERPTEAPWKWADREVWLDDKMTADPGPYQSSKTPWMREIQELPLRPEVRQAFLIKSSRSGGTEGGFNILRWMPDHWPGNAGIIFPDDKKAREVADRRIINSLKAVAGAYMSADPNDTTMSRIALSNMEVLVGGSGSSRMFTEIWFRYIQLEELDEHDQTDTTGSYERALSRQTDVPDALLFAPCKPKETGCPSDKGYVKGTQKKWLVPCPRCTRRIEFQRQFFRYDHCREGAGWNLQRIVDETWYQCPLCQGRIEHAEKFAMVDAGIWVPTPEAQRRRDEKGNYVPNEPGVESYNISDYYSYHAAVSWGNLMKLHVMAFEITPTIAAQHYFINNYEGWPADPEEYKVTQDSIDALKAGRVEEIEEEAADGTKVKRTVTLGEEYRLAYRDGVQQAPLPFKPEFLLIKIDKQESFLKYLVWAIMNDGQAFLVDLGRLNDEDHLFAMVRDRKYFFKGMEEPLTIAGGLFDSRFRGQEVYRVCLKMYHELGVGIWPVRGEGESERFKGRTIRYVKDYCDGQEIIVRYFYDNSIKNEFYITMVQKRCKPRIWLPVDIPDALKLEWTAERLIKETGLWDHNKEKHGPNDWGDCGKFLALWRAENLKALLEKYGHIPADPGTQPDREVEEKPPERDYTLQR